MKKLTLEIVNKIINNCKDDGSYFSGINETKDTDLEVWDIPVYCDISKEFIRYTLVKTIVSNEYEEYTEYSLEQDCDGEYIDNDFGKLIQNKASESVLHTLAFVIFAVFGVFTLFQGVSLMVPDNKVMIASITAAGAVIFAVICLVIFMRKKVD